MTIGRNGVAGKQLRGFIERIERLRLEKRGLADDEKQVFAEAKAAGFDTKTMRAVIKRRELPPGDVQEAEAMLDLYLHATGMRTETPLFAAVGAMSVDLAARDEVIAAFKQLVPHEGEIIVKVGGTPVRLWRDEQGEAHAADWVEPEPAAPAAPAPGGTPARQRAPVPNCTEDQAEELGAQAARDNVPIIKNPFPHDDARRPRWDVGWRCEAGSDGMGEDD